jgi:hypothetical protein
MTDATNLDDAELGETAADHALATSSTAGVMSEAEAARYFRNALIGLMIGTPSFLAVPVGLYLFGLAFFIFTIQFLIFQFVAFLWGFYYFIRLKGYIRYPALLGVLYWLGLLLVLLLPNRNSAGSAKVTTLSFICYAWLLLGNGIGALLVYYYFPWLIYPVG